jgi:hypothetical protein
MLPIPFFQYLPKVYREAKEPAAVALADKMDELLKEWRNDVIAFGNLYDPERCPRSYLDALGDQLQAGILKGDSERIKRKKLRGAIESHKLRSTWQFSAKPIVDSVIGGDSSLVGGVGSGAWLVVGDGTTPSSYDWSLVSGDGDVDAGLLLLGIGTEPEVKGNVYIDVDDASATIDELDRLEISLGDILPAYFRIHLGYVDGTGSFVEYRVLG